MFYKAPDMTPEQAKKRSLIPVEINVIGIMETNIDKTKQDIIDAWGIVKKPFVDTNNCWVTIGYIKAPSLWKRFIDFWWVK